MNEQAPDTRYEASFPTGTVTVGVDGSTASLAAVRWATEEAVARRHNLALLYATPFIGPEFPDTPEEGHAHAILAGAEAEAKRHRGEVWTRTRVTPTTTVTALVEASEQSSLLVLGLTGAGGAAEILLGSTTLAVSGKAHCPVVGVRRWPLDTEAGPIVLGVSSVPDDAVAIEVAFDLANRRGRPLVVVHAGHDHPRMSAEHPRPEAELDVWRRRYPNVHVEYRFPSGDPSTALLRGAGRAEAIVTGSRRRGPVGRALLGSTSRAVLRHSPVPVIVANPDALVLPEVPTGARLDPHAREQLW
ncbi:universal stress protein [Pseudonocardia eucalypti]|uniref:Universal stress protein n=1 Tax=Pseudonocardia eucalypti TaxID=648755 RepID=A0ABP9QIC4_9PSEU|nr:nucleotide-binding universal stress UspA family protein [Pseudonocardia eucalypti]